ncbi:MAG TPA: beta-N-acetylhexosaminidase [Bacillota bacterium]|nr:beta-N-acetylhexosaminidase [Bacillota bacterium]
MIHDHDDLDLLLGQMFIFGFEGLTLSSEFVDFYKKYPAGGVILFRRNLQSPEQVKLLNAQLLELAKSVRPEDDLLKAIDQEGGNLSPLRGLVTSLPGNMGLAATNSPSAAYFAGLTVGNELKSLGFNLNFAPVLDLALQQNPVISTRAFSDQPDVAAIFGKEYAQGISATGILFTAKHFPGHGSCAGDSHLELPSCTEPATTLRTRDLIPFQEVIRSNAASVMMAHVKYESLDPDNPASLSSWIIQDLLRDIIGFQGVVITDCLEMSAIQNFVPYPEDAVRAIEAGNDIILISHTPKHQMASFKAVKNAIISGRITIARIEESVARIRKWKQGRGQDPSLKTPEDVLKWTPESLAEKAITLKSTKNHWHFNRQPLVLVMPIMERLTPSEDFGSVDVIETELAKYTVPCKRLDCASNPTITEIQALISAVNKTGYGKVVLILSNISNSPGQLKLIEMLAEANQVLLICTRNPQEVSILQEDWPVIFTYSTEVAVLKALAKVLSGETQPGGKLPIVLGSN